MSASALLSALLPPRCGACSRIGSSPCPSCWAALHPAAAAPLPPGLAGLVAVLAYEGAGRELVARLKYRNARATLTWLATAMAGRLAPALLVPPAVVTWAPTTARRRRTRGFDHAQLLATAVAAAAGVPCEPLLERLPGAAQTGRPVAARRSAGPRFRAVRPPPRTVLVVDDVCTTGATLSAAATALRGAGADRVVGVVAARTPLKREGVCADH